VFLLLLSCLQVAKEKSEWFNGLVERFMPVLIKGKKSGCFCRRPDLYQDMLVCL
jgi:hypothetical protein